MKGWMSKQFYSARNEKKRRRTPVIDIAGYSDKNKPSFIS
jgi:hypothetical protein